MVSRSALLLAASAALAACHASSTPVTLDVYGGWIEHQDADLDLSAEDGTDLTLHGVELDGEALELPIYWGVRVAWWLAPEWALALDFTHSKAVADTDQVTRVTGTNGSTRVSGRHPISDYLGEFQLTHGHNFFTLNALRRWVSEEGDGFLSRTEPYVGIGAGVALPHVEANFKGKETSKYMYGGPAAQALGGLSFELSQRWATFLEYRVTWQDLDLDLDGGSDAELETLTQQFIAGLTFRF